MTDAIKSKYENLDPYDMKEKARVHPKADEKNRLALVRNNLALQCGARKRRRKTEDAFCKSYAGSGTDHPGYGRCKYCGGSSTGPKTPEGIAASKENGRTHGFYSKVLRGAELDTYAELTESKTINLEHEIFMLKAKILTYLEKWQTVIDEKGEKAARNYTTSGLDQERSYYTSSTADDRVLQRALSELRRLVDSHSRLNSDNSVGLLDSINAELRGASQGEVTLAWGSRSAQRRKADEQATAKK